MYDYFKNVLKITKEKHLEALEGRSATKKKLQKELIDIRNKIYNYYKNKELSDDQYKELIKEFRKISFENLTNQRRGTQIW